MQRNDPYFHIDATRDRVQVLRGISERMGGPGPLVNEVFAEISESLEELAVAEEELNVQTEQLKASREIIEAERYRYRRLFEFAPDGYMITDEFGVIREANWAALNLLNTSERLAVGKPLAAYLPRDMRRSFRDRLSDVRQPDRVDHWECIIKPRGGSAAFIASMTVSPDVDHTGSVVDIRWMFRDVTEEKRKESRVIALNEQLEKRVAERTAELEAAYQREHRVADVLQRALLHTPPSLSTSIAVETFYESTMDEAMVGGDFYDVFHFHRRGDDGSLVEMMALVVGDVSGKGLNAAVCAASVKYALRTIMRGERHAAAAVAHLNDFVCTAKEHGDWSSDGGVQSDYSANAFVTLALGVIDPTSGQAEFLTAGSDAIQLLKPDGTRIELETKCVVLGVDPGVEYRCKCETLEPGDLVVMATDGLTESRRDGEYFGMDGIVDALSEKPDRALQIRGERVLDAARSFARGSFKDDVCLLLAQRM